MPVIQINVTGEDPAEVRAALRGILGDDSGSPAKSAKPAPTPTPAATAEPEEEPVAPGDDVVETVDLVDQTEIDAAGNVWDESLHTSTRTKTKDGQWRRKPGAGSAPDLPEPEEADKPEASTEADDEFTSFQNAMADEPVEPVGRSWTDADLTLFCNEAAKTLGSADPVKAAIGRYVPEGQVAHSRNIPVDERENFAQELEKTADFTFSG